MVNNSGSYQVQYDSSVSTWVSSSSSSSSSSVAWINTLNSNNLLNYVSELSNVSKVHQGHSKLGSLYFYCTISREANYTASLPDYLVEKKDTERGEGYWKNEYVSDTIQRRPFTLQLTIFESEIPANDLQAEEGMDGRLITVKDALLDMADRGQVIELVTPDTVYDNLVITGITFPEDDYLNAMEINVTLQRVYFTESTTIASTSSEYEYEALEVETTDTTTTTEDLEESGVAVSKYVVKETWTVKLWKWLTGQS